MPDFTANLTEYAFKEGDLYIGEIKGHALGVTTNRHAITVAGSRTGKGVGVINTNLRTWPHNALVIDPKGEAASVSWKAREEKGQAVYVLDPFGRANIPSRLIASYNPLDDLDVNALTIAEDIDSIADGIVMRSGEGDPYWDDGGMAVISGLIAFVMDRVKPADRNLITVRQILIDQREGGAFETVIDEMANSKHPTLADLMRSGAGRVAMKEGAYFISNALSHTKWLSSKGMRATLSRSSFSMNELKRGKVSVFVALPFKYLPQQQHGRLLRLMVRCGIGAMQEPMPDGSEMGEKCLFILDEFFSLGYINEISTSIGGMASHGLHLWPFLQDLDQLWKLYGRDGAGTFFGSSDLHQFFGVTDPETLKFISERIGNFTVDDLPPEPRFGEGPLGQEYVQNRPKWEHMQANPTAYSLGVKMGINDRFKLDIEYAHKEHNERLQRYNTDASRLLGKPRMSPQAIAHLIRLEPNRPTAESQIAFVHGVKPMFCDISRYFEWKLALPAPTTRALPAPIKWDQIEKGRQSLKTKPKKKPVQAKKKPMTHDDIVWDFGFEPKPFPTEEESAAHYKTQPLAIRVHIEGAASIWERIQYKLGVKA